LAVLDEFGAARGSRRGAGYGIAGFVGGGGEQGAAGLGDHHVAAVADEQRGAHFVLKGAVVTARTGDLLVVPPGAAHAFGAHRDSTAEALVIATPGTHFLGSPAWQRARSVA
jgi:hypothetical protein